jgi:hypothetical protein
MLGYGGLDTGEAVIGGPFLAIIRRYESKKQEQYAICGCRTQEGGRVAVPIA